MPQFSTATTTAASLDRLLHETLQKDIMGHLEQLKASLLRNPEPIFKILRSTKPILLVKNLALVTRFQDVTEVLSRDWVFRVTYGE